MGLQTEAFRELAVDRAIYAVDDAARTYWFARGNPVWRELSRQQSCRNQLQLEGYTRVFRRLEPKTFRYAAAASRRRAAARLTRVLT